MTALDWRSGLLPMLLLYALCRGLLLIHIVPPWQGPDEPSHAEYVVLSLRERGLPREPDPALQVQLLRSMEAFRWHAWLAEPAPSRPPSRFEDLPRLSDAPTQVGNETPLGYLPYLPAAFLGLPLGLAPALGLMRGTSLLLLLLSIALTGIVSGKILDDAGFASGALPTLVATMPMLGFAGAMLGTDLPATLLAILWFGLAWSEGQDASAGRRLALLALAAVAGLAKRSAIFLLPLTVIFWLGRRAGADDRRGATKPGLGRQALGATLGLLAACLLLLAAWPQPERAAGWDRIGRQWGAERLPEAARSGRAGLRIVDDSPDSWQYLEQWIPVSPGDFVAASAWFREAPAPGRPSSPMDDASARGRPRAQLVLNSEAGDWWNQTVEIGEDWRRAQLSLQVPTGVERLRIALVPGDGTVEGMARLDVDDLRVTVQHTLAHQEMSRNGDAEAPQRLGGTLWDASRRYLDTPRLAASLRSGLSDPAGSLATAGRGLSFSFLSFWGGFGWLTIWPGGGYYGLARILTLWALAGWLLALLRPIWLAGGDLALSRILRHAALATMLALIVAIAGSMAGTAGSRLPQGRYLLPALPAMLLPAVALAERLAPRRGPALLALASLSLDLWALFWVIWPAYRGPA